MQKVPSGHEGVVVKRTLLILLFALSVTGAVQTSGCLGASLAAVPDQTWKSDFDRLCGQTDNAGEMSAEELKKALESCDALKPRIEALEATPRKVYLKRLQMCRNLFAFLLESKEKK